MQLSLIVLKSADPKALSDFYARLGISIVQEQHGDGPIHFAGSLDHGVIEIYPARATAPIVYGITVSSINAFQTAWLAAGGRTGKHEHIVIDPDGNSVHLSQGQPRQPR